MHSSRHSISKSTSRSSSRCSLAHPSPNRHVNAQFLNPIPAFGVERDFPFEPNAYSNCPSYNARTTVYYPVEPHSIKAAQARVDAIKESKAYKQLELDQQLITEFHKINLENRKYLEELLKSEKAKYKHSMADSAYSSAAEASDEDLKTPTQPAPEPTYNWQDFRQKSPNNEKEFFSKPCFPLRDSPILLPDTPPNTPDESGYLWHRLLADLEKERRHGTRVPDHQTPEQFGFTPDAKQTDTANGKSGFKPTKQRPKSPWPGQINGNGKGKAPLQYTSSASSQKHSLSPSSDSCSECSYYSSENVDLWLEEAYAPSDRAYVAPAEHSESPPSNINAFSGLPYVLIPAHPSHSTATSHDVLTCLTPATSPLEPLPDITPLSPLQPKKPHHATRAPRRHESSQQSRYWPLNPSPSGRYHPIPFPPLFKPDPYVAWPGIPTDFQNSNARRQNADVGTTSSHEQIPPNARSRRNHLYSGPSTASTPATAASFWSPEKPPRSSCLGRAWSFVRGKKDVVDLKKSRKDRKTLS